MITESRNQTQRLVAGRAGELTHNANTITFDLLEKIFGCNGPYQNVLRKFGVNIKSNDRSFLVLQDKVVYTDLNEEEKILWRLYPVMLVEKSGEVIHEFTWKKANPVTLFNYARKILFEGLLVANIGSYQEKAHEIYKGVSHEAEEIKDKGCITLERFFEVYEKIIYVSYLYEYLYLYNGGTASNVFVKQYIEENDYLIVDNTDFMEFALKLPNGFYLDDYEDLQASSPSSVSYPFIPDEIDRLSVESGLNKLQCAEKELQCLKNNLRLKTNILMYFLNLSALENAKKRGLDSIGGKRLADVF
ncbi:MAG: hypothetical protein WC243_02650 [Patescibacteria group bacterium]|jgi:hypothetical protein